MRDRRNTSPSAAAAANQPSCYEKINEKINEKTTNSSSLPAPVTDKIHSVPCGPRTMAVRVLVIVTCVLLLGRVFFPQFSPPQISSSQHQQQNQNQVQVQDQDLVCAQDLPDDPTALIVAGTGGGAPKWTVSIPHRHEFPLAPADYRDMCAQGSVLRATLAPGRRYSGSSQWWHWGGHRMRDATFVDVHDAERAGFLPLPANQSAPDVCDSTLTFVLESEDASFGKSLLLLWLAYGIAQKEGRAFFIDDSRWSWGRYASYFTPPPMPSCSRPDPHYFLPCAPSARHVMLSAATAPWALDDWSLRYDLKDMRSYLGSFREPQVYRLLRTGYHALFHLTEQDATYAESRAAEIRAEATASHSPVIGMQIRRGDLHPFEYQYNMDYLPLERYTSAAQALFCMLRAPSPDSTDPSSLSTPPLLLASDDPDIFSSPDLHLDSPPSFTLHRTHDRITLATKSVLDTLSPIHPIRLPGSAYTKHIAENSGWEGGFYSALFFSLGSAPLAPGGDSGPTPNLLKRDSDPSSSFSDQPSDQALRLRELVGRAYLLDLAILERADGVVCAVSSATCRVLGVIAGSEKVRIGAWRNVDDGRGWEWE